MVKSKKAQSQQRSSQRSVAEVSAMGRPRSLESEQAILTAAWALLQTTTVRKISIEAIAREAGVGKTTIYRWWPSKAAVLIDAFLVQVEAVLPFPAAESATDALTQQIMTLVSVFSGDVGQIVAQIIAEGQCDSAALENFRERFLTPRRDAARQVIQAGIESGEFDATLGPDVAMDILYGPIYYRLLVQHLPLDRSFGTALTERAIVCLLNPEPSQEE